MVTVDMMMVLLLARCCRRRSSCSCSPSGSRLSPASVPCQCGDEHGDEHGDEDVPPLLPLACVGVGTAGGGLLLPGGVDGDGDGPGVGADESEVVTLSLPASSILLPISCVPHHAPLLPSVPVPLELLPSALLIIPVPCGGA